MSNGKTSDENQCVAASAEKNGITTSDSEPSIIQQNTEDIHLQKCESENEEHVEKSKKRQRPNDDESENLNNGETWQDNQSEKKQRIIPNNDDDNKVSCTEMTDAGPKSALNDKTEEPKASNLEEEDTKQIENEKVNDDCNTNDMNNDNKKKNENQEIMTSENEVDETTTEKGEEKDTNSDPKNDKNNTKFEEKTGNDTNSDNTDNFKASKSIFCGLFSHDIQKSAFSNPFQKQAAEGEAGFLSYCPKPTDEVEEHEEVEENVPVVDLSTGEENEEVKFEETRVILKKFIAKEPNEKPKWQGSCIGRLKLLEPKEGAVNGPKGRILMRNVGTYDLLINSPLKLAKSLTKQDTTSHKFCAIFSALNQGFEDVVPHCVVFDTRDRRDLFISTSNEIRDKFNE